MLFVQGENRTNRTVRCGTVFIFFSKSYSPVRCGADVFPTVRCGSVFNFFMKFFGVVRCGAVRAVVFKSSMVRCGALSVEQLFRTVRFSVHRSKSAVAHGVPSVYIVATR